MMINDAQINLINNEIDVNDRGLAYGDGIFESIAYVNGVLHNWSLHWQRLNLGAERLSLMIPSEKFLLNSIEAKLNQNNEQDEHNHFSNKVIKIIITRGKGGRGYQFPQQAQSSLVISIHHWPERPDDDYIKGIRVKVCQTCLALQPLLAGIKHLNRLEQVFARNELNNSQYHDGILLTCSDKFSTVSANIIEGTSSNLFFVKNGQLYTPEIETCGVQGTIRQEILQLAKKMAIKLEQGTYSLDDLSSASEVFFTNSIFGIVPVASITSNGNAQWGYAQSSQQRISARLSRVINKALNRPVLL